MPCNPSANPARRAVRGLAAAALAVTLAGCYTTRDTTGTVPSDYRLRHPIAIKEAPHTLELFVGAGRGGLSPSQRAETLAFAHTWRREATGGVTVYRPIGVPNQRAAQDSLREVLAILAAAGVPSHGIGIKPYRPSPGKMATLRLSYPLLTADAGPCGLWPDDLGPSYEVKHFQNRPYYNFGCATQRNLAAQVANPSDLVQPRAEGPVYTAKRTFGIDKWRKGETPATTYPDTNKAAISDLGK